MDISIAYKPTYINMDLMLDDITFAELLVNNALNSHSLENLLGTNLD